MEIVELPLKNHYIIFTHKGFSTFILRESNEQPEYICVAQDIPLRFCYNLMKSDPSNRAIIQGEKDFHERFKFFAIKYFGMPILADMRLKDVIRTYEKPLEDLLYSFDEKNHALLISEILTINPKNADKMLEIQHSPLYVFARNGVPDLE